MTKLRITHFHDPDPMIAPGVCDQEMYDAWKARQIKPEIDDFTFNAAHMYGSKKRLPDWYVKALQHYEENRRRFDGFEEIESEFDSIVLTNGFFDIVFWNDQEIEVRWTKDLQTVYHGPLSVSLFEKICSDNGIKLKKL